MARGLSASYAKLNDVGANMETTVDKTIPFRERRYKS
jgi:hypothetical protein